MKNRITFIPWNEETAAAILAPGIWNTIDEIVSIRSVALRPSWSGHRAALAAYTREWRRDAAAAGFRPCEIRAAVLAEQYGRQCGRVDMPDILRRRFKMEART